MIDSKRFKKKPSLIKWTLEVVDWRIEVVDWNEEVEKRWREKKHVDEEALVNEEWRNRKESKRWTEEVRVDEVRVSLCEVYFKFQNFHFTNYETGVKQRNEGKSVISKA